MKPALLLPSSGAEVLSEINTTPLVDVMLVLLIVFLITIPVVSVSIKLNLPQERVQARQAKPDTVVVSVNAAGAVFWHDTRLAGEAELLLRLRRLVREQPQAQLHIRGDAAATFVSVDRVLQQARQAGVAHIALLTTPPRPQ